MKPNLKYIELFESFTGRSFPERMHYKRLRRFLSDEVEEIPFDIPYSKINVDGLNIIFPEDAYTIESVFNHLTTEVTGCVTMENTQMTYIEGFDNLEQAGQYLTMKNNQKLNHIYGFNNLKYLGWNLTILGNPQLKTVDGFQNLKEIHGDLKLMKNEQLTDIPTFNNLEYVHYNIHIEDNLMLPFVKGFNKLKKVKSSGISIENNPELAFVDGFEILEKVGIVRVGNNDKLITISLPTNLIKNSHHSREGYYGFIISERSLSNWKYSFKSPEEVINSDAMIQDCIEKFNPNIHGDVVVKNICNNLEFWGTPETIDLIVNHLKSKGVESAMFNGLLNKRMNHQSGKMIMDRGY